MYSHLPTGNRKRFAFLRVSRLAARNVGRVLRAGLFLAWRLETSLARRFGSACPMLLKRGFLFTDPSVMKLFGTYHSRAGMRAAQSATRFAANEVSNRVHKTGREFSSVDDRIDRLAMLCEAMWELISENTDLDEQDLQAKFTEIDERDGRQNYRRQRVAHECGECGAKVPPVRVHCQFCGAPAKPATLFDLI